MKEKILVNTDLIGFSIQEKAREIWQLLWPNINPSSGHPHLALYTLVGSTLGTTSYKEPPKNSLLMSACCFVIQARITRMTLCIFAMEYLTCWSHCSFCHFPSLLKAGSHMQQLKKILRTFSTDFYQIFFLLDLVMQIFQLLTSPILDNFPLPVSTDLWPDLAIPTDSQQGPIAMHFFTLSSS